MKIPLITNKSLVKAPEFCNYQQDNYVSPSICSVCKLCTFVPTKIADSGLVFTSQQFSQYLLEINSEVFGSIISQQQFLLKKSRTVLAILVSSELLLSAIQHYFPQVSLKERYVLLANFVVSGLPICYIFGAPVYYSRKLSNSLLQVVGEVTWK